MRKAIVVLGGAILLGGLSAGLHLNFHHWISYVLEGAFATFVLVSVLALTQKEIGEEENK